jgi:hypothetical protein
VRLPLRAWLAGPCLAVFALVVLVGFPATAGATVGVGVQSAPVRLGTVAHPGTSYPLPPVYVVNTGTEAEAVTIKVERLSPGVGRSVPPSWIHAKGVPTRLRPHQAEQLSLELVVPSGALSGTYLSDIVADGSAAIAVGTTNFGVAAATKLEFTVSPSPGRGLLAAVPPWAWGGLGGLLAVVIAIVAFRRSGVHIRIERASSTCGSVHRREGIHRRLAGLAALPLTVVALLTLGEPAAFASGSGSTTVALAVVPTRSITVSPATTSFASCSGGKAPTASTASALGYPNGECSVGKAGTTGVFPITIKNTGTAGDVDVNGASSVPSDKGTGWVLCNAGSHPAPACTGAGGDPGVNQYKEENFAKGEENGDGLTSTSACDPVFDPKGGCTASAGQSESEGIELLGPSSSSDTSTSWTSSITWTAVAS